MTARWTQAQYQAYQTRTQPKRRRTLTQIALDEVAARLPEAPANALVLDLPMPPRACWPNSKPMPLALHRAKAALHRDTVLSAMAQIAACRDRLPLTGTVEVSLLYVCTLRRVRDRDGMISAAKALLDGLTDAGLWLDDRQVSFGRVEAFVQRGGRERVVVWVKEAVSG